MGVTDGSSFFIKIYVQSSAERQELGSLILFLALSGFSLANSHAFLPISVQGEWPFDQARPKFSYRHRLNKEISVTHLTKMGGVPYF